MKLQLKYILLCLIPILTGICHAESGNQSNKLSINTVFHASWWSPVQMENMDLDNPPTKNTDVIIDKWEYSDPVGVPHPDAVELAIELTTTDAGIDKVYVVAIQRWKIGSITKQASAQWTKNINLNIANPVKLVPGRTTKTLIKNIDLKKIQEESFKKRQWPWLMEIQLMIFHDSKHTQLLGTKTVSLPMIPAD